MPSKLTLPEEVRINQVRLARRKDRGMENESLSKLTVRIIHTDSCHNIDRKIEANRYFESLIGVIKMSDLIVLAYHVIHNRQL